MLVRLGIVFDSIRKFVKLFDSRMVSVGMLCLLVCVNMVGIRLLWVIFSGILFCSNIYLFR